LIRAVRYVNEPRMPPDGKLLDDQIEKLAEWVKMGAPWPAVESAEPTGTRPEVSENIPRFSERQRGWWAYQPVERPPVPPVANTTWAGNEIDRFVLSELESRGMRPAQPADRRTWIRRATVDLTGLLPTVAETRAFLADSSRESYEKVVDRLLASPAYGQRWARHWLDVARYADHFDADPKARDGRYDITEAWRYRDWVVDAWNADLPFNQFIVHQIAGDLLQDPKGQERYKDGLIATTFLTNGVWDPGDADKDKIISDMVDDNIDTVGKAFLATTLGCCRCHDHKFDPVSQEDYYALAGMFYSTHFLTSLGGKGDAYIVGRVPLIPEKETQPWREQSAKIKELQDQLTALDKAQPAVPSDDPKRVSLQQQLDTLNVQRIPEPPWTMAVQEGGTPGGLFPGIQDVPIHIRGNHTRLGPVVRRRLPEFLASSTSQVEISGSGRHELANWIASRENPLTARVIVNRLWQWHFGTGLVRNANNFGLTSEAPSHPALLDWLATRLVDEGWSLKKMHRRIMLSSTYRQSSQVPVSDFQVDPENRWLGRFSPRRFDAEVIRDAILSVTDQLDSRWTGPSVDIFTVPRRSLYVQTARWDRSNFATLFDAANPDTSTEHRTDSTVAPQSLLMLNHPWTVAQAERLADQLLQREPKDSVKRIRYAYELLYARGASDEEIAIGQQVLSAGGDGGDRQAWQDLAHVLLCSNEFIYMD